jgi:hypothetical protein
MSECGQRRALCYPRLQDLASIGAAAPPSPSPSPRNPAQGMTDLRLFPMIFPDQIAHHPQ